ncbi:MAG: hypothetical protein ACE5H3_00975 [Planctomycetota bacterium]
MSFARRLVQLGALVPYGLSAGIAPLTPARAVILAWIVEAGVPGPPGRKCTLDFLLRHLPAWWLLHALRPDAPLLVGPALLAFLVLTRRFWADPLRGRGSGAAVLLLFLLPAAVRLPFELSGRKTPSVLQAVDLWEHAGVPAEPATRPPLPVPSLPAGARLSGLRFRLPPSLAPPPLGDSPQRGQALTLAAALFLAQAGSVLFFSLRVRRPALFGLLFLAAFGSWSFRGPPGVKVVFREDSAPDGTTGRIWTLEVHAAGAGLWDPLRGALLPPPFVSLHAEKEQGLVRVVASRPWGVVREGTPQDEEPGAPPLAWLEHRPLQPEHSGGAGAGGGWLGFLRYWARGEPEGAAGVRWSVSAEGVLFREPLP